MDVLRKQLESCLNILNRGARATNTTDVNWLNDLCAALLEFSTLVHSSLCSHKQTESAEMVCLCLTQIMICIRQVESTMKLGCGASVMASHQYFLDRIRWCLKRLMHLYTPGTEAGIPERSFLKLVDTVLDTLAVFSSQNEENADASNCLPPSPEEVLSLSNEMRVYIDLILGQSLGFANVALSQDKRGLSALCQKVIRECNAFQGECKLSSAAASYHSNLKLKAMTLEQALYQLEDFINDALLRLVFTCFLDFEKFSVDKIRTVLRNCSEDDDAVADELIADFDVNIDRATQIGIFAIAFAPNLKLKTMMRSCLASFESLDTSLIPSLQAANGSDLHSDILEQHFNEEVAKFKAALQEIIDSRALLGCYLELLSAGISSNETERLEDLSQMSLMLLEHFHLETNRKVLNQVGEEYLHQFVRILRECKAILMCASQVEPQRILKRFKILRTILRKLHDCLGVEKRNEDESPAHQMGKHVFEDTTETDDNLDNFTGLSTGQSSILYDSERRSRRVIRSQESKPTTDALKTKPGLLKRESLRTVMFKRQNIAESRRLYNSICNQSADLEITDILDQLTGMSNGYFEC